MTSRRGAAVAVLVVSVLACWQAAIGQQAPVFRAGVDLVAVDVFVRDDGTPVTGLTAADFIVLDNGIRQRIESIETARVPIDLSLLADVSGGRPEWWGTPRPAHEVADDLAGLVERTSRLLKPDDRLRLLTIDTYTEEILPFHPPHPALRVDPRIATAGMSSVYDGLVAVLLRPAAPDRRHVIIAVTKAEDTISTVELASLQDIARRSDAVLHIVLGTSLVGDTRCLAQRDLIGSDVAPGVAYLLESCKYPRRRFWRPFDRREVALLPALAESTGGAFYGLDALALQRDFGDEVERLVTRFRQGYVLRYTPQGVGREGWHDLAVSVPSRPRAVIQARRGYAVDAVRPAVRAGSGPPGPRMVPPGGATVEWLADAFEARQYEAFEAGLARAPEPARLLRDVRMSESRWPSAPRAEAVFAVELAIAGLNRADSEAHDEAGRLLEQQAVFVRHPFGADRFECAWYRTGIAGLQGLIRPALAETFVARAIARCPDEPRFHLAAAVVADQHWPVGTTRRLPRQTKVVEPGAGHRAKVTSLYEAAMQFPSTATEARVRASWFALRVGEAERALRLVDAAAPEAEDPHVRYMREFVRAQVLRDLGRHDDAAAGFRRALAIWPDAQSARLALMALQIAHGDRAEAEALAEAIQTTPGTDTDPWWRYWQGDFRAYTNTLAELRGMAR